MVPLPTSVVVRVSTAAFVFQGALVFLSVVFSTVLPKERDTNGNLCAADDSWEMLVLVGIAFASLAVGAVALASSFTAVRRAGGGGGGALARLAGGLGAAVIVVIPFAAVLITALCGLN